MVARAPVNQGKPWSLTDAIILVCLREDGFGRLYVAEKLGRSEYAVECQEERIKQQGKWQYCLERRSRVEGQLYGRGRNNPNCRCVIKPIEGEECMSNGDKVPFLKTEVVTTTYLNGRDITDYSDEELMKMLSNMVEKRDKMKADLVLASTKMAQAKIQELTDNARALVEAMDKLFDDRQAEAAKEGEAK